MPLILNDIGALQLKKYLRLISIDLFKGIIKVICNLLNSYKHQCITQVLVVLHMPLLLHITISIVNGYLLNIEEPKSKNEIGNWPLKPTLFLLYSPSSLKYKYDNIEVYVYRDRLNRLVFIFNVWSASFFMHVIQFALIVSDEYLKTSQILYK